MNYNDIMNKKNKYNSEEKFTSLEMVMKLMARLYKTNKVIFEYSLYAHFVDYLRYICLKIYLQNKTVSDINPRIFKAYVSLLDNLDMIESVDEKNKLIRIKQEFICDADLKEIEEGKVKKSSIKKIYNSYRFIVERQNDIKLFKTPASKYIRYLIIYTRELENISLKNKIKPSFEETFYTDLGEVAFKLFNKENYVKILPKFKINNILDVGCGNGNFIDTYLEYNSSCLVYGVERQSQVCKLLKEKYKETKNVVIINDDVTRMDLFGEFDLINISYMLFYLPKEQQQKLLYSLAKLLSNDGKIVVCQYFPDIEEIQMQMAVDDKKWSKIDRYKFKISNSILYSEVLLNDGLSDFDHASRFDEFSDIISDARLKIESVEKADNNYYSFYFILKKEGK